MPRSRTAPPPRLQSWAGKSSVPRSVSTLGMENSQGRSGRRRILAGRSREERLLRGIVGHVSKYATQTRQARSTPPRPPPQPRHPVDPLSTNSAQQPLWTHFDFLIFCRGCYPRETLLQYWNTHPRHPRCRPRPRSVLRAGAFAETGNTPGVRKHLRKCRRFEANLAHQCVSARRP